MKRIVRVGYKMRWLYLIVWVYLAACGVSWMIESQVEDIYTFNYLPSVVTRHAIQDTLGLCSRWEDERSMLGVMDSLIDPWNGKDGPPYMIVVLSAVAASFVAIFLFVPAPFRNSDKALPAIRKLRASASIAASLNCGLLGVALAAITLHFITPGTIVPIHDDPWNSRWLFYDMTSEWNNVNGYGRLWSNDNYPSTFSLLTLGMVAASSFLLLQTVIAKNVQYWMLERVTMWIGLAALVILLVAWGVQLSNSNWDQRGGPYTAIALSYFVLLWAITCRLRLLFLLSRYEKAPRDDLLCFACEYDLRGTIAAGRTDCPECGVVIHADQMKAAADNIE